MSARHRRKSSVRAKITNLMIYLLVAVLALLAGRFLYDWFNFGRGHRAYVAGDCFSANRYYKRVISGWRVVEIGNYNAMAEFEMSECEALLETINLERNGQFSQALQEYLEYLESHPESELNEAIRQRSSALFAQADPTGLVNEMICTHTNALLEQQLVPQRQSNLPELHLACAHFYAQEGQVHQAYAAYVTFLTEYPEHESGHEAENGLVENALACQKPELLRDSALRERPDFLPKLYYTCGLNFESAGELDSAIPMFLRFLREYPEHRFKDQIATALARSIVAQTASGEYDQLPELQGRRSTGSEASKVSILNGSAFPLLIAIHGTEAGVVELKACPECSAAVSCPASSPAAEFSLRAGEYQAVIQASQEESPAYWLGSWYLEAESAYSLCFTGR